MPKALEIACYVLVPLAWGLAVELILRLVRRSAWRHAGAEMGDEE